MKVNFPALLIVDDDPSITRSLRVNLEADGFDVLTASDGAEAMVMMERRLPDLVIVDLVLPDMHGFDLCDRIKSYLDVPILMLTGVGSEDSVVDGLERYAEDYVVKPFSYRELLARINRVLKRTHEYRTDDEELVVDSTLRINFARHLVFMGANTVRLTPVESRLLAALARRPDRVVPSKRLIDEAWPDGEGDPSRLWVNIGRIRQKIEQDPAEPKRLLTERGVGYMLRVIE